MSGIVDIKVLLKQMKPILSDEEYVFCTKSTQNLNSKLIELNPIATFIEKEGVTLVLLKNKADEACLNYEGIFNKITLEVHSSLDAVGLTSAISTSLTKQNISANVIAGFYHDHIFVPKDKSSLALETLILLTKD